MAPWIGSCIFLAFENLIYVFSGVESPQNNKDFNAMTASRMLVISAVFVLVACDDLSPDNYNHYLHYGSWYSYETALGIRYRDDTGLSDDADQTNDLPPSELIDRWYMSAVECSGLWVDPRTVAVLLIRTTDVPPPDEGHIWYPGLIVYLPESRKIVKHEFLHFILYHSGEDYSHNNPLFTAIDEGSCY